MAKVIMIQGTMSNAGKSLLTAGLCRIFRQDGYRTAPFKSQNMALNSFITADGLEMGRAQVVQAQAAGVEPVTDMNPVLLKPSGDTGSQVVVNGVPMGHMTAKDYFSFRRELLPVIKAAYDRLDREYDIIVIEGAGSPAEINLKKDDIVNMGIARMAGAPVLLAGDIDRGGVFAQLYGTVELLEKEERAMIKGLLINKFRGDRSILEPGIHMLEELCHIPVAGVVPYLEVDIEDEDSLSGRLENREAPAAVDIAAIAFPRLSNFTDLNVFSTVSGVSVRYVKRLSQLGSPDLVILPGTKNTMEDMLWMRQSGLEAAVKRLASGGTPVFGICGGYQMMGSVLYDPEGTESGCPGKRIAGMELFSGTTCFETEKTRTRVRGQFGQVSGIFSPLSGMPLTGYEIHMGQTEFPADAGGEETSLLTLTEYQEGQSSRKTKKSDGRSKKNLYGTYVHGIFDGPGVAAAAAAAILQAKGESGEALLEASVSYEAYRELQFDKLARGIRQNVDMDMIYKILNQGI